MNNRTQFDPAALSTLKPGMDAALDEIGLRLEQYLAEPAANGAALRAAQDALHRLLDVLKMLRMDGMAVFCGAIGMVLDELAPYPDMVSPLHRDVLKRALAAVTQYLAGLSGGSDNAALRLFPQYQELQQLRGMEMSFEQDLFYPELAVRLPDDVLGPARQADAIAQLKAARSRYQQALLQWLRKQDASAALQTMQQAVESAMRCAPQDDSRAFWWVGNGLIDCMRLNGLPPELSADKLLGRIDQQMRAAAEGSAGDVQAVMNDMLYLIACSHSVNERVEQIKQVYALERYLPEISVVPPDELALQLDGMRQQLLGAEESWELCAQGDATAVARFKEHAAQLLLQSETLDRHTLQYLARQIQQQSQSIGQPGYARIIALDMAMALLLLGKGIEHYGHLGGGFHEQARILAACMHSAADRQPEDAQRMVDLVGLHSRMERGEVQAVLLNAMLENLGQVGPGLKAFFDGANKGEKLSGLQRLLEQVCGGLRILSLEQAARLALSIRDSVRSFAQGTEAPKPTDSHALAAEVEALENYLRHLALGRKEESEPLLAALTELSGLRNEPGAAPAATGAAPVAAVRLPHPLDEEQELLEVFLEEAHEVLDSMRDNLEIARQHPESREPVATIRRGFHTLKGSGRMVGLSELGEVAWAIERAMNKWLQDNRPVTRGLLNFIERSAQVFSGWVETLDSEGDVRIEAHGLIAAAARLEQGLDLGDPEPVDVETNPADILPTSEPTADVPPMPSADQASVPDIEPEQASSAEVEAQDSGSAQPAQHDMLPDVSDEPVTQAMPVNRSDSVATERTEPAAAEPATGEEQAAKPQVHDDVDAQLLPVFLEEADDLCPKIGEVLRDWYGKSDDARHSQLLKRLLHTFKGSARMAGAMRIGELVHEMEDHVLAAERSQDRGEFRGALEGCFDRIAHMLEELRSGDAALAYGEREDAAAEETARGAQRPGPDGGAPRAVLASKLRVRADVVDRMVNEAGEIGVARSRIEAELHACKEGLQELTDSVTRLRKQLREMEIQADSQMQARAASARDGAERFDPLELDRYTRLQELTRFMNESVHDVQAVQQSLAKNIEKASAAASAQARLNRELQQTLMSVRMMPFSSISERLYRIVRQTAKELGKRANLELLGTEVELDRSVLERMIAPFEHLLRNAIAHGLESDRERALCDKKPIGEIRLSLRQENNEVVFEFGDDGAGLNYPALREKAIAKGLLEPDEAVGDEQLAQLIFISGITTATEVTEVVGRGIGMDVVRTEIAGLGGHIEVSSRRGHGTQFIIHLPLTLAITQALMVRCGTATYAIPCTMVEQARQVEAAELANIYAARQIDWQGRQYPLHYLPHLLGDAGLVPQGKPHNSLLLLRSGDRHIALHVDELLGNHEAVVKNVGPQLARLPGIAGATVQGNGAVVLILNPVQLAQRIGATTGMHEQAAPEEQHPQPLVMVVDDSLTVRKVTTRLLARAGYQVVTAKDGLDALDQLRSVEPAAMLLDIEMPRMDGFELTKRLRGDAGTRELPIVMITSRTADKHRDYALQLGANAYLGKPYQEDELLRLLAGFVAARQAG